MMFPSVPGGKPVLFTLTLISPVALTLTVPEDQMFIVDYWYCISVMDANVANRTLTIQYQNAAGGILQNYFNDVMSASQEHHHQFGLSQTTGDTPVNLVQSVVGMGPIVMPGLSKLVIALALAEAADQVTLRGLYRQGPVDVVT